MCMLFPAVCDAPASMFAALGVADAFVFVCSLPARCDFLFFSGMDTIFHLDSAAPPMLLRGGKLRPVIHTAFASMLMYHQERLDSGEMRDSTSKEKSRSSPSSASLVKGTHSPELRNMRRQPRRHISPSR